MAQEIRWDPAAKGGSGSWTVIEDGSPSDVAAHRVTHEPYPTPVHDDASGEVGEPTVVRRTGVDTPEPEKPAPTTTRFRTVVVRGVAVLVGALLGFAAETAWHLFDFLVD